MPTTCWTCFSHAASMHTQVTLDGHESMSGRYTNLEAYLHVCKCACEKAYVRRRMRMMGMHSHGFTVHTYTCMRICMYKHMSASAHSKSLKFEGFLRRLERGRVPHTVQHGAHAAGGRLRAHTSDTRKSMSVSVGTCI
jgi:hypothetical protein